jgi:UDP-N-acetylglucosamine 1-carboxyvinyltransferase
MIRLDSFVIKGGRRLSGTVRVSGSKNAALPCLFATLLTDGECVLENVPDLQDIRTAVRLLERLGKKVEVKKGRVSIRKRGALRAQAPYDLVRRMRASAVVMGPLLARLGRADVSLPGGCAIGARPINFHLKAFEAMGARISVNEGYISAVGRMKGARVKLPFASVGATENILMAASLAQGRTTIENAAREPEITDLANLLTAMGARCEGAGTDRIRVDGVPALHGVRHRVIPDRIEAGTFLVAAAMTRGRVRLTDVEPSHLTAVLDALRKAGVVLTVGKDTVDAAWVRPLRSVSIKTRVYPGFPTDMQAQWMALMAVTPGTCVIDEDIFENRFLHAQELLRMDARIETHGHRARVEGAARLSGCPLMVSDLRAGAALVLAGLAARGTTKVLRVYHLDRGYERLEKKLRALGADIRRVPQ